MLKDISRKGGSMETILIVDDEKKVRNIYRRLLQDEGFKVLEAENAVKAKWLLESEHVDVMLLDINMPEITGDVLYEIARIFNRDVKIIVTSVYPVNYQKEKIEGAVEYFDKSEGLKVLIEKVKKVIQGDS
jgi:DNA-binding NtrC family response regulator